MWIFIGAMAIGKISGEAMCRPRNRFPGDCDTDVGRLGFLVPRSRMPLFEWHLDLSLRHSSNLISLSRIEKSSDSDTVGFSGMVVLLTDLFCNPLANINCMDQWIVQ